MVVIGEIFLSAFVAMLFQKLAAVDLLKFKRSEGISSELKKWTGTLLMVQAVLSDAEEKQNVAVPVKEWLRNLQDLAYDLDDIVDDLTTQSLPCKSSDSESQPFNSKVQKFLHNSCCISFPVCDTMKLGNQLALKIKHFNRQLESLVEQISFLNLVQKPNTNTTTETFFHTTSLVNESCIFGRQMDKERLIELLLRDVSSYPTTQVSVSVISVVGMAGVCKTTLARLVYNDARVSSSFNLKAWCCVTHYFDIFQATRTILEAVTARTCDLKDLNMLQVELKKQLSGKKFLIVLDDVWNEKHEELDILLSPLMVGLHGSKVIATTRNEGVATAMSSTPVAVYHLMKLMEDDALSLLAQHALQTRNFDENPLLEKVGRSIVKKCENLPLAIKTLGRLLSTKTNLSEWMDVLNNEIWDLPNTQRDILPALHLSYHHLPSQLKRCFAYCAIFPKGYQIDRQELVLLWMAEGLLQLKTGKKLMEELGRDYFDELLSRSFFQYADVDNSCFMMHDLINDLAKYVAGDIYFSLEDQLDHQENSTFSRGRHMSYAHHQYGIFSRFQPLYRCKGLRTFLPLLIDRSLEEKEFFLSNKVTCDIIPKLSCLRVLSLTGYSIYQLPNTIGNLKHLRYLNLSGTSLKCLPTAVSLLYNLQTLSVRNCHQLLNLPPGITRLVNLRHLDNGNTVQLQEMPLGIGRLTNVQTLSKLVVSRGNGMMPREVGNLLLLRGSLSFDELQNVIKVEDARGAKLTSKHNIEELKLVWSNNFEYSRDENFEQDVLDALEPSKALKILNIDFYGGAKFSCWIGDRSFSKLSQMTLNGCRNCKSLPPVGQLPSLKSLTFCGMHQLKFLGSEFYGKHASADSCFPSLETLRFEDMPNWEEWSCLTTEVEVAGQFPQLRNLHISRCYSLKTVAALHLPLLCELELQECNVPVLQSLINLTSLKKLHLESIGYLSSLKEAFVQFPMALEVLDIYNCNELVSLWQDGKGVHDLVHLQSIKILMCPQIMSIEEIGALPALRNLHVIGCDSLEIVTSNMSSLEELRVESCLSLKSSKMHNMNTALRHLQVKDYTNTGLMSRRMLEGCSATLEHLEFSYCPLLDVRALLGSVHFRNLSFVLLNGCDCLEYFPEDGLPIPKLEALLIGDCKKLKSLPNQMETFSCLEILTIYDCPSIKSFPQSDLPPNLLSLSISNCGNLKPLSEWSHKCNSLHNLKIWKDTYPKLLSFSHADTVDYCILPPNLRGLHIGGLPNLVSLSKGLEMLTSLCHLRVENCPKLRTLPAQDLLDKLWSLTIKNCPHLEKKCLKNKGEYFSMIRDIPCVKLGNNIPTYYVP